MVPNPVLLLQHCTDEKMTSVYGQDVPWFCLTSSRDFLRERKENLFLTADSNAVKI